jgi:SAM-dependent methyltransferase
VVAADCRTLEEVLADLLPDADRRRDLAEQGVAYAGRHHGHVQVARRCLEIYAAPTPAVPAGADPAELAADLRLRVRRASAAFAETAGSEAPDAAAPAGDTRSVALSLSAGAGGGAATATLEAPAAVAATATARPADVAEPPRFPFPVEPLPNPRLALPLHERFGQSLEDYVDDKFRLGRDFFRRRIQELGLEFDGPVLDMGCGPGQWALTIAEANPGLPVTACDRNDFLYGCLVEKKREMDLANLRTVQADIRTLPFEDASFATVLCIGVLQLVRVSEAFAELVRVTRPGGRILINVPGAGFYARNSVGAIRGGRRDILRQNVKFVRNTLRRQDVPFTFFTRRRLRGLAAEHGLRLARIEPTGLYPPQKPRFLGLTVNMDVIFERPAT